MIKGEKEVAVGKVVAHLCLALIIKELKISAKQDRVVTTLNIIKHEIPYAVYCPGLFLR